MLETIVFHVHLTILMDCANKKQSHARVAAGLLLLLIIWCHHKPSERPSRKLHSESYSSRIPQSVRTPRRPTNQWHHVDLDLCQGTD